MPPTLSIVPARAATDERLDKNHFRVLEFLGSHTNKDRICCLRQRTVSQSLGLSRETVNRKLKDLATWEYVEKLASTSPFGTLRYRILFDVGAVAPATRDDLTPEPGQLTTDLVKDPSHCSDALDHIRCDRKRAQQERPSLNDQDSPLPPTGGLSGKLKSTQGKSSLLAALRQACRHSDAIEYLIAPLLARKRHSLGKDSLTTLIELAEAASDLPRPALTAAANRLLGNPHKLTKHIIRTEIDTARKCGAMFVIGPGMPEWQAWREYYAAHEPKYLNFMESRGILQVPSQWPPEIPEGAV